MVGMKETLHPITIHDLELPRLSVKEQIEDFRDFLQGLNAEYISKHIELESEDK
jgi:hypothetical protein